MLTDCNNSVSTFRPYFPQSIGLRQAAALISATHALSFYSLTLQHGVPFQPVSIRVSQDPISLIGKVLEQNSSSYTQLDDLVGIAQNLVSAGLPQQEVSTSVAVDEDEPFCMVTIGRRLSVVKISVRVRLNLGTHRGNVKGTCL